MRLVAEVKKKLESVGNERLNGLLLSFISPLIFCLHSSPSCQRSLFRFYARQCSLKVSRTPEKIADDRCAGGTCLWLQTQYLSPEVIRANGLFQAERQGIKHQCAAQRRTRHRVQWLLRTWLYVYLPFLGCRIMIVLSCCTHISFKRSETELPHVDAV